MAAGQPPPRRATSISTVPTATVSSCFAAARTRARDEASAERDGGGEHAPGGAGAGGAGIEKPPTPTHAKENVQGFCASSASKTESEKSSEEEMEPTVLQCGHLFAARASNNGFTMSATGRAPTAAPPSAP